MLSIYEKHKKLILSLAIIYGVILAFPAFGPVLNLMVGIKNGVYYGSVFLFFLLIGFIIPPQEFEGQPYYSQVIIAIAMAAVLTFNMVSPIFRYLNIAVLGATLGRYVVFLCHIFIRNIDKEEVAYLFSTILLISYGILYVSNVIIPATSPLIATGWIIALLAITLFKFSDIDFPKNNEKVIGTSEQKSYKEILIVIFLLYLTAGTTYAGIYIDLKVYQALERYYNVLPFLATVLFVGSLVERWNRDILLYTAICSLGLAFVFTFLPTSILTYILIQTFLQIGWALLDAYVWIAGAYAAYKNKNPLYITFFVAVFLFGTFVGSIITTVLRTVLQAESSYVFNIVTQVPLFASLLLLGIRQYKQNAQLEVVEDNIAIDNEVFNELTSREKEVVELLVKNYTYKQISEKLFISPNTLKTHTRHIYKKLDVNNKKDLIKLANQINNS